MTAVWILGRGGLLGSALSRALQNHDVREWVQPKQMPWDDTDKLAAALCHAAVSFGASVQNDAWHIHLAFGTCTMASTPEELSRETTIIRSLLSCIEKTDTLMQTRGTITFASSAGAVYAATEDDVISEASIPKALNAYGLAKLEQENMLRAFVEKHTNMSLFIARLSNLYGAAQSRTKKQGLLSHIARSMLLRTPINIFVPFDTIRDYVHVDDAAAIFLRTLDARSATDRMVMKIIASERPVSIAQIIGTFKDVTHVTPRVITSTSPLRSAYVHRMKFRSTVLPLQEKPSTSLLVGIAQVMAAERLAFMRG